MRNFVISNGTASALASITGFIVLLSMPAHIRSGYYRREDGYRLLKLSRKKLPPVYKISMLWSIPKNNIKIWALPPDSQEYFLSSEQIIIALGDFR